MRWVGLLSLVLVVGTAVPVQVAASQRDRAELDVLFVGAHPDDEAGALSTLGQFKVRSGVVTVTRGEGGGNAVGTEEGPELGRLREAEERRAVGKAGITDVFNLDKADFYYTVSSPLTEQAWGREDTLGKLVRVIRQTKPKIIMTMNPAPSPGNHGNHQYAARLAIEAYQVAADPKAFRDQGLRPWAVSRLFTSGLRGSSTAGPNCVSAFTPSEPTDRVWGAWAGEPAYGGQTWAQVERAAQREYASQGWAGFPDVPTDPAQIGCDYFTQLASRVPYRPASRGARGLLEGAVIPGEFPVGTTLSASASRYAVTTGSSVKIAVTSSIRGRTTLIPPPGWTVQGDTVTVPTTASQGKARIGVQVESHGRTGFTEALVEVVPALSAAQQPLPQVAQYQQWTREIGYPELAGSVAPVLTLPSGGGRDIDITIRNQGDVARDGTVSLTMPAGFTASPQQPFPSLAPGASAVVRFSVRNTDSTLKTGQQGGDYQYSINLPGATARAALELVPATAIPQASASPVVDGVSGAGEYTGPELDISPRWEGDNCASPADCSATAKISWRDDTLFALVTVTDDVLGARLATADCKRHWRTDSVELTIDPRGRSENTSTTYKLAVLPVTAEGPPCALRDADNHQGAAPGVRVASKITESGYTVEFAVPLSQVPGAVDPANAALNVLVYDSDTQDKTGQTRIGWSTWGGVQGDPYRWGRVQFTGYTPPPDRPIDPPAPVLPLEALASVDSPQSIAQSVRLGLPPGAAPAARPIRVSHGFLLTSEKGTAYVFAGGQRHVLQVSPGVTKLPAGPLLLGFVTTRGATAAAESR
ncbi:LmbE family N-acetylglucosaminyl deacetylase [Kibdelosporangium banguiense]|uniref:LmbE family N-acetylglucosaminyl deacetylase n=1 Tax=Kibdelosporangium banguiense TaxID=1365924 RepID=A0ABS4TGQ0_9PSEU|nr:sugar-binding protein [Kibdelosporangium banguiense]MBP2323607.1 LmbE family N-acetylglucosaminyl deacetylase [Kibdelosporangium banguiense]